MSNGLEAMFELTPQLTVSKENDKRIDIIEKELKALEIMKKNISDICMLFNSFQNYTKDYVLSCHYSMFDFETLTEEEYDLLKEVLL